MKLRALLFASFASLAFTQVGCFGLLQQKPAENIGGDWTSPLDSDLAVAAPALQTYFKSQGWDVQLIWAGARGTDYGIERGPLGEPVRKSALAMYAYEMPKTGKCYLMGDGVLAQHTALSREHIGGGQYAAPKLMAWSPLKNDGEPVGREVVCSAVPAAKGGVHGPFDHAAPKAVAVKPADSPAPAAANADANAKTSRVRQR